MRMSRRNFKRIPSSILVGYSPLLWSDNQIPKNIIYHTHSFDISISGIGLINTNHFDKNTLQSLQKHEKKLSLYLYLYETISPIPIIAKLNWSIILNNEQPAIQRAGFEFLNIHIDQYRILDYYIDNLLTHSTSIY